MILLLGTPGAGKTTQTELLAKYLKCPWFSMGDIIRAHTTGKDRAEMQQGKIIDDKVTIDLLWGALEPLDLVNKECIVEGNPRSIPQADWWLGKINGGQIKITGIIYLVSDIEKVKQRLIKRGRFDDQDSTVLDKRFAEYERSVVPTLKYLKEKGQPVHDVDAMGTIEEVTDRIHKALGLPA